MSNTFSSSLVVDTATSTAITVLQNRLAPIKTFTTDFSNDVVSGAGLRKLQVGVVANAAAAVSSPTSFESQGSTINNTAVTMTHYSAQFGLSSQQLNQGFRLEKLMKSNLRALANALLDAAFTNVTTSNFGNASYSTAITTATGGNIGNSLITAALPKLWSDLKDGTERYLVLDGSYYSYLLPATGYSLDIQSKGAYGFDGIFYNNRWSAAGIAADTNLNGATVASGGTKTTTTNYAIKGFAVSPEAMAVASAIPYIDPAIAGLLQMSETIDIPDLGISVQFNVHGSLASRSLQASFDVLFGANAADTSALKIING